MTDAEKLQALIELAWEHGYRPKYNRLSLCSKSQIYVDDCDFTTSFTHKLPGDCRNLYLEEILFDHEFIKALCFSKYGDSIHKWPVWELGEPGKRDDAIWHHVKECVVYSTKSERIGYLYKEFVEC